MAGNLQPSSCPELRTSRASATLASCGCVRRPATGARCVIAESCYNYAGGRLSLGPFFFNRCGRAPSQPVVHIELLCGPRADQRRQPETASRGTAAQTSKSESSARYNYVLNLYRRWGAPSRRPSGCVSFVGYLCTRWAIASTFRCVRWRRAGATSHCQLVPGIGPLNSARLRAPALLHSIQQKYGPHGALSAPRHDGRPRVPQGAPKWGYSGVDRALALAFAAGRRCCTACCFSFSSLPAAGRSLREVCPRTSSRP